MVRHQSDGDAEAPLLLSDTSDGEEPEVGTRGYAQAPKELHRSTLWTVCPFILGNEFCERLAYYGLATNLITYLNQEMGEKPAFAAIMVQVFEGTCYLTPLLGAWLADSRWGRYKTILVFSAIYVAGMVSLALSDLIPLSAPTEGKQSTIWANVTLYTSLYIISIGTGGIKPNVSAFGADQFDSSDPQDRKEKASFFNWFYFAINLGSLLAVTVIVYIQDNISWAIGFGIPAAAMVLACVLFIAGSPLYTHVKPTESPMTRVMLVVRAAMKNKWARRRAARQPAQGRVFVSTYDGPVNLPPGGLTIAAAMRKTHSYGWLDEAIQAAGNEPSGSGGLAVAGYSEAQVEEVRLVIRLLPVFFATILYWTIYAQMGTFFIMQGTQMDRRMFGGSFYIPSATLSLFNVLAVVALIPVYDRIFVPLLQRFGKPLTLLQRIGWGLVVCIGAMLAASLVEARRLELFRQHHVFLAAGAQLGKEYDVVEMSVFYQIPQYLLIGLSEILASIGQLEFFYNQAPDVMRSCSMALQLLSVAIGSYSSGLLVYAVGRWSVGVFTEGGHSWLPDDLNHGRVDLFFLLLAGLMLVNLAIFLVVALRYEYKPVEHTEKFVPRKEPPPWARAQPVYGVVPGQSREVSIAGARITPEEDVGVYGRSVTFVPPSPNLTARFR